MCFPHAAFPPEAAVCKMEDVEDSQGSMQDRHCAPDASHYSDAGGSK